MVKQFFEDKKNTENQIKALLQTFVDKYRCSEIDIRIQDIHDGNVLHVDLELKIVY